MSSLPHFRCIALTPFVTPPVSGSDTICNSSSTSLTDIVHFGPLHVVVRLVILKGVYYGEGLTSGCLSVVDYLFHNRVVQHHKDDQSY